MKFDSYLGEITHKEWCEHEVERLNTEIPNYAFYRSRDILRSGYPITHCCVVIDGKKIPKL